MLAYMSEGPDPPTECLSEALTAKQPCCMFCHSLVKRGCVQKVVLEDLEAFLVVGKPDSNSR